MSGASDELATLIADVRPGEVDQAVYKALMVSALRNLAAPKPPEEYTLPSSL